MRFPRWKQVSSWIGLLPLSYLGLSRECEFPAFVRDIIIGPVWESIIFQGVMIGIPLSLVRKSWHVPWVQDPIFDRLIKSAIVIGSIALSGFIFITFHRPGHFETMLLELRAKRILRRMEAAWLWGKHEAAVKNAHDLLLIAEELWIREGSDFSRFLQGLSLYVICNDKRRLSISERNQRVRMEQILSEVRIWTNDILQG